MILCAKCGIQFSSSCLRCPACNEFETPAAERQEYLRDNAVERIHDGEDLQSVREILIHGGFVDYEVDEILGLAQKQLRSENRWYGFFRLIIGGLMLICGLIAIAFALEATRLQIKLGKATAYLLFGGLAAVLAGGLACVSGLYAVVTGRESAIAPPDIL